MEESVKDGAAETPDAPEAVGPSEAPEASEAPGVSEAPGAPAHVPLPADVALAASALCEATLDDSKAVELLQRYWGIDEATAERAVAEARGRLLMATRKDEPLSLVGILELEDRSLSSVERYIEEYVEQNAEVIRTGVQGGGIKFVVNRVLRFLYKVLYKYIAVFVEPILALVLKIFPFIPL